MSVQRWTWNQVGEAGPKAAIYILYADHARIVAEAQARWVEIARQDRMAAHQRGAQEAERQHAKALADMEQAHAAALAAAVAAARAEVVTVELVGDYATGYNAGLIEGDAKGRREGKRLAEAAAAPRTLTAADPEPAVTSVGLDRDQSVWQRVGSTEHSRWVNPFMGTREWSDVLARGPVRLIHDGEATPQVKPCSTCGEPVAYLTARPGWAGGWLHHPARPLDGHPAAIDGEATT